VKWSVLAATLLFLGCSGQMEVKKKLRDEACTKNLDCAYGLECVAGGSQADAGASPADGGTATAARTCQFHSFGDCDGDGTQPGPDGQPQCLSSYKCRDGHCTVQCAGHKDCRQGEVCKVGICHSGSNAVASCFDNRDCRFPETCYYGQCVTRPAPTRCSSDLDCPTGTRCMNGVCQ
jgi:hypothetical protein